MADNIQDWMDWATGITGADAPDPILTQAEIEQIVDDVVATYGTFHTDTSTLPETATSRPRGIFTDPHDLLNYLADGGLVGFDEFDAPMPLPIVHIVKTIADDRNNIEYEVWIDDDTP